ncbi:probable tyrosyl-DNA phosphodiesterase [Trichogramma pretiosum]|uniref:probable tyrosyl-DNA phosphodiesterase n=1 Tax=Trichogramma pretiosum TaxID=7493 RepID=UPI0006C9901B|nr:probable tyrosyl-DNA phosphodiesterase [Trichogramma pretiosum]
MAYQQNTSMKEKTVCPFKEKCYRKNPIHFSEMSHLHLERLIEDQLYGDIILPSQLGFECPDRSALLEQLKVLQIVMRKEGRGKVHKVAGETSVDKATVSSKYSTSPKKGMESEDMKTKIEKSRQSAIEKRKSKQQENESYKKLKVESDPSLPTTSKSSQAESRESKDKSENLVIDSFAAADKREVRFKLRDRTLARMASSGIKLKLTEPGDFAIKFALSAPYHYFFNKVEDSKVTHDQQFTVSFPELLDIGLGEIVKSLHINFMVEIGWLCLQYLLAAQPANMTIFYHEIVDPQSHLPANIKAFKVPVPTAYSSHHTKISVLKYVDGGIRVIVSTANIYSDDWKNRTQGVWVSPHLPKLPDETSSEEGESPTKFKKSFQKYLASYKHTDLNEWISIIKRADFSSVNVFFVASVPGSHKDDNFNSWGLQQISSIFSDHLILPPDASDWGIIAQASSIGSLGSSIDGWLSTDLISSMAKGKSSRINRNPSFQFVYPSSRNYASSFDCADGSCCLPYSETVHLKQQWLNRYLYVWKSDEIGRTKAIPHSKTYVRISPDQSKAAWFILTSANLSKAAWGSAAKKTRSQYIMNYEAGVVFLPQFVINESTFPLKQTSENCSILRLPYDLPLQKYKDSDEPFAH